VIDRPNLAGVEQNRTSHNGAVRSTVGSPAGLLYIRLTYIGQHFRANPCLRIIITPIAPATLTG